MRAPETVFKLVKEFWDKNKHQQKQEKWPAGYVIGCYIAGDVRVFVPDRDCISTATH
jgi:hypothetical protein